MARTLVGEIFNQLTGHKDRPSRQERRDREREHYAYKMKEAAHKSKRAYEDAQTRAYIKGWKK